MDNTDFTGGTTPLDREIDPSVWKGFALAEIASHENIDAEEISPIFDLPCFVEFTQEEAKIQHRIYVFLHNGKTALYDLSYWKEDDRPLYDRNIETTKILPSSGEAGLMQFDTPILQSEDSDKTVWIQYSKKEETLKIIESPLDSSNFTILDAENIEHANKEAQED